MKANIPENKPVSKFDKLLFKHVSGIFELLSQYQKIFSVKCGDEGFLEDLKSNSNVSEEMYKTLLEEKAFAYGSLLLSLCLKTMNSMVKTEEKND